MKKTLNKTDFLFAIALLFCILFLGVFIFTYPYAYDESFYATIPFRIINGDALVQDEWHLTQFSSLFSYLPIRIWLTLKGSADGVIVFSRCVYFSIHTLLTIIIYIFFRKYNIWAIAAAIIFFTQSTHRFLAISYHSMFVAFLLLLTFSVILAYKNNSACFYFFTGVCYALCCICNPTLCIVYVCYLAACVFCTTKKTDQNAANSEADSHTNKLNSISSFADNFNFIFTKKAALGLSAGILIIAAISVAFYCYTGGTISSLINNISNILSNSDYRIASSFNTHLVTKFNEAYYYIKKFSFNMPYLFPLMLIILLCDKNRKIDSHRFIYLLISIILSILFALGLIFYNDNLSYAVELPFAFFSTVCYILTDKKNKTIFYFMWIPSLVAAIFHFFTANSHLLALSLILTNSNVAGVIFVGELYKEISTKINFSSPKNKLSKSSRCLLCISLCLQIIFHCFIYQYAQLPDKDVTKATKGPYSGIYMTEEQYNNYSNAIAVLDLIKERSDENSPVLIASYNNWMYMYIERPIAVPTTWYLGEINQEQLTTYYKENPDKIPEYIYIDSLDYYNKVNNDQLDKNIDISGKMFEFTKEELSNGVLLKVKKCKLNY